MERKDLFHNVTKWFSANMEKAESELHYDSPFHLLIAVILSAQCTDRRVNMYTPAIFERFPEPCDLATATFEEVYELIKSISFPNNKAKHLIGMAAKLVSDFGGIVPSEPADLEKLPGVGRKTANLMLGDVFKVPGVVVADTHCIRITGLLGLTDGSKDPTKVEMQLRRVLPPEKSNDFCHRMVLHGRAVCIARRPQCAECTLRPWCDHFTKGEEKE